MVAACHLFSQRCLIHQFAISFYGCFSIVGAVRALPVIVVLPFSQKHVDIGRCKVDGVVELDLICLLGAFDLPVQMRRGRFVRAKLDPISLQAFLDDDSKKLTATICLYALNGERHFFKDAIKELQSIVRSPASIYSQNPIADTVVHGSVLIQAGSYFTDIHLYPLAGNRALVTREVAFTAIFYQRLCLAAKKLVNGCNREGNAMESLQLTWYAPGSQATFPA